MMFSLKPISILCPILLWTFFALYFTLYYDSSSKFSAVSHRSVPFSNLGVPPKDDPDDVQLLKRASQVNPYPTRPGKKVAFLFLTTTPLHFAPLWEQFFSQRGAHGKYNVYVHADPTFKYDNPSFTSIFSGRIIPSMPTRRNTPTLIMAARRLLAYALLDDPTNHIFTILSDTCIPIHSFNFTYTTLAESTRSFIEILKNEPAARIRWAARGTHVMLPEVSLDVFRIGSQFWSLTRRHARLVVSDVMVWNKFRRPCRKPCFPEESYFPTLMSMVDPRGVVPTTLTHVNWRKPQRGGHPHLYDQSEIRPELIKWLRESRPRYGDWGINGSDLSIRNGHHDPFLFARKFAPNCLQPLLSLANDVLFKD